MTTTDPKLIERMLEGWPYDNIATGVPEHYLRAVVLPIVTAAINEAAQKDKDRLDYLMRESHDLRCFPVPTGGDDADIGWRVVGHFMAEPQERTIAEVFHDDPRAAIDAAIEAKESQHG